MTVLSPSATSESREAITAASISKMIVPESSPQDDRSYGIHTTSSGLTCLLVSDPTTDKASAAMDVRVGHFSDPDHIPGK